MPIGGQLILKGGKPLKKKKKKSKKKLPQETIEALKEEQEKNPQPETAAKEGQQSSINPTAVSVQSGKAYEEEFSLEMEAAQAGKSRSTPWGSSFAEPPKILHGYDREIKGDTAEERLDLRCARRTDKFCK
ncbi:hypothetical protein BSKO_11000 [Bryopsis sp. KO-2023]|nr:hypothetical protein BSKO_11000 [Bryopsis sp. KO-2023]